jgi:hypothetical protein
MPLRDEKERKRKTAILQVHLNNKSMVSAAGRMSGRF